MKVHKYVALLVAVQLLFSLSAAVAAPSDPGKPEAAFSNKDVIKLVKLELGDDVVIVRIVIDDKETRLPANRGDLSATGAWPVVFTFLDYPGLHARTRTKNTRPTLVVRSEHDPKGYYYLGKLDVNDEEDNNRSLKIEQKASGFSATTRVIPAGRWYVEYESSEKTPGIWYLTPKRDLHAGEYGVVVPGGVLYEFGVD
jgi:hypothetical protein